MRLCAGQYRTTGECEDGVGGVEDRSWAAGGPVAAWMMGEWGTKGLWALVAPSGPVEARGWGLKEAEPRRAVPAVGGGQGQAGVVVQCG